MEKIPYDASNLFTAGPSPAVLPGSQNRKPYFHDMPEFGSLADYYRLHFKSEYLAFLQQNLACGSLPVGKRSRKVPEPQCVSVTGIEILRFRFTAAGGGFIHVETLIRASIHLYAKFSDTEEYADNVTQLYKINGSLILREDCFEYSLIDTAHIFYAWDETTLRPMSEYLVPILCREEMDDEAERILRRYYPELLKKPGHLNARILAEGMGLGIRYARLTPDGSILGQVFFEDSVVPTYADPSSPKSLSVSAGTILIDEKAVWRSKGSRVKQTIIHECVHYVLHSLFYRLQKIYLSDIQCITCPVSLQAPEGSPVYWIEWQANQLVPRLVMPAGPTKAKIRRLMEKESEQFPGRDELYIIERVICDLAEFYDVSRESARLRMIELGYPEAVGTMNYCNDSYVPRFRYDHARVRPNQTFTVSDQEAFEEYTRNARFRKLIDSNRFVFVESHLCLRGPRYVCPDPGGDGIRLTDYARNHVDECCLCFQVSGKSVRYLYRNGTLKREKPVSTVRILSVPETWETAGRESGIKVEEESLAEELERLDQIKKALPGPLADTARYHMNRLHLTLDELSARSHIPRGRIVQIRKGGTRVSLETALALCFGMHLEPELSYDLLKKAGAGFGDTRQDSMYQLLLRTRYYESVGRVNALLIKNQMRPLTRN